MMAHVKVLTCDWCHQRFWSARNDAHWCSNSCKQKAYRARAKTQRLRLTIEQEQSLELIGLCLPNAHNARAIVEAGLRTISRGQWNNVLRLVTDLLADAEVEGLYVNQP